MPEKDNTAKDRADQLLRALIELHVGDGRAVGSRTLAREAGLSLSPATIRNVMADLEEMGLIESPHTSAGRVPTPKGYRVFVDRMMTVKPLDQNVVDTIQSEFATAHDRGSLVAKASNMIAELTQFAGIVMLPGQQDSTFKQIEFLNLSGSRVLAILISADGQVQNRVIGVDATLSDSELIEAANYFNDRYSGRPMADVRKLLLGEMHEDSHEINRITQTLAEVGAPIFDSDEADDPTMVVAGEERLMDVPELAELKRLRRLFDTFKTKHDLVELLDKSLRASGISIFIGDESGHLALNDVSVVVSPYEADGRVIGVVGVVGPTRMAYDQVVPVVDITARLLGNALSAPSD